MSECLRACVCALAEVCLRSDSLHCKRLCAPISRNSTQKNTLLLFISRKDELEDVYAKQVKMFYLVRSCCCPLRYVGGFNCVKLQH